MKSIGFVVLDREGNFIPQLSVMNAADQKKAVKLLNASPNVFDLQGHCPLVTVEAFINED